MGITNLFSYFYNKIQHWSAHKYAPYYLAAVSFVESSVFPIPPDVMLISMGLAKPEKSWQYAAITTIFSVMGGIFGYALGYFCLEFIQPWLMHSSFTHNYLQIVRWFKDYGVSIIFLAGCTPIPYKLFTIAAGILNMALIPFIFASLIGRGIRFFLVAAILYCQGKKLEIKLRAYIDRIGWLILGCLGTTFIIIKWVI